MKDKELQIIEHYGINNQLRKLQEEVFELSEAITKNEVCNYYDVKDRDVEESKEHIVEELSDVLVLLTQFREYYNIDDDEIRDTMSFKINRQIKRIEAEKKNE